MFPQRLLRLCYTYIRVVSHDISTHLLSNLAISVKSRGVSQCPRAIRCNSTYPSSDGFVYGRLLGPTLIVAGKESQSCDGHTISNNIWRWKEKRKQNQLEAAEII